MVVYQPTQDAEGRGFESPRQDEEYIPCTLLRPCALLRPAFVLIKEISDLEG